MIIGLIVLGGGALGLTAYLGQNKENELVLASPSSFLPDSSRNLLDKAKQFVTDIVDSVIGEERQKQQVTVSTGGKKWIAEFNQLLNRDLVLSLAITGITVVGVTLYPVLSIVGAVGVLYIALPVFQRTSQDLQKGQITTYLIDTILVVGMLVTGHVLLASFAAVAGNVVLQLLAKTENNMRQHLIDVFDQQPRSVWVLQPDTVEIEVPFEQIQAGDIVVVNAGETIPVDGLITTGLATIDQRMLTGEANPVEKEPGDKVFAATVVLAGRIGITVEQAGTATVAAQISKILNNTQDYKDTLQARGQEIANDFAAPTLILGSVTWPILGSTQAVTILWSGLGYSMRFLGVLSVLNFLQILSKHGVLIKDGRVLESLPKVDTIVFDKTGTLTLEQLQVGQLFLFNDYQEEELLIYAATAEYRQTHPVAKAILATAQARHLVLPAIEEAAYNVGYGIKVKVGDQVIRVGSARFLIKEGISLPTQTDTLQTEADRQGYLLVYVAIGEQLGGVIELQPSIRPEAKRVIQELRSRHIDLYIVSGDHIQPTRHLAKELEITSHFAEMLPENKADLVSQLQEQGKFVCFVGDGINDSIAMKKANVSISLRGASTAALDTAQIILMDGSLNQLAPLFGVAHDLEKNLQTNVLFSFIPGAICIGGVLFLNFGLVAGMAIYYAGLAGGLTNTMLPLLKYQKDSHQTNQWITEEKEV